MVLTVAQSKQRRKQRKRGPVRRELVLGRSSKRHQKTTARRDDVRAYCTGQLKRLHSGQGVPRSEGDTVYTVNETCEHWTREMVDKCKMYAANEGRCTITTRDVARAHQVLFNRMPLEYCRYSDNDPRAPKLRVPVAAAAAAADDEEEGELFVAPSAAEVAAEEEEDAEEEEEEEEEEEDEEEVAAMAAIVAQ